MPAEEAVDELLNALEGSDGSEGETPPSEPKPNQNPVRELRKFAEQVLKEKKQADAKNLKLEEDLARYRSQEEASLFSQLGLDEKRQKLFKAVNPDTPVTKESVEAFVTEYGFTPPEEGETPLPVSDTPPVAPFAPVHNQGTAPDATQYSSDAIIKMIMAGQVDQAHEIVTRATRNPNLIQFKHADKMPA